MPPAAGFDFPVGLSGTGPNVSVLDPDSNPNTVLDTGLPFYIRVEWSIAGGVAPLIAGTWYVSAYADSVGPGPEVQVGATMPVPLTGPLNFSTTITVPPGALPSASGSASSGVYELVTIITHTNVFGVATEMTGFAEGPLIQMRTP